MFVQDERGYNQVFPKRGTSILRAARRTDWIARQLNRAGALDAIEIGCGLGETAFQVAGATDAHILAVDISAKFIAAASERFVLPNLEFRLLDVLSDDFSNIPKTDAVFGIGILHHLVPLLPQALSRLRLLVRDGGTMLFIEPNLRHPICRFLFGTSVGRRLGRLEPQEMAFLAQELEYQIADAGWVDVEIVTRDFLLPGLPRMFTAPSLWLETRFEASSVATLLGQSHFIRARAG